MRLKYIISEVATGLWRNVTMTIAMIITMTVSLTLLGASVLLYWQVDHMRDVYYEQVELSIFLEPDSKPEQREAIDAALKADPLVKSYHFETREEAYERFKEIYRDAPDFVSSTKPDSMPESFRVKLKNTNDFNAVDLKYKSQEGVDDIVNPKELLGKVFTVLGSLQKLALIIAIVQGAAALLLVINTIQVAAYSKRRDVAVMKLVGASNWFIQAPFVLEAVAAGLIGAVFGYATLALAKHFVFDGALQPLSTVLTPMPWSNVHLMLPLLAAAGSLVSAVTGWIALRFYIKT